jgi:hypothetical protein
LGRVFCGDGRIGTYGVIIGRPVRPRLSCPRSRRPAVGVPCCSFAYLAALVWCASCRRFRRLLCESDF